MTDAATARLLEHLTATHCPSTSKPQRRGAPIEPFLPTVSQWWRWLPTYWFIQQNPHARKAMKNHPGVKLMKHANLLFFAIILFIAFLGQCYQ